MKKSFIAYFLRGQKLATNRMKTSGFTVLELAIVIIIMTTLSTLIFVSLNATRQNNRNSKRVSDIKEMQTALAMYYRDWGAYPLTGLVTAGVNFASGTVTYLSPWPSNPTPRTDGTCPSDDYNYTAVADATNPGASYTIRFCLSAATADIGPGTNYAIPDDIITCVPNCVLSCNTGGSTGANGCGGTCVNAAACSSGYTCTSDHCIKN